MKIQGNCYNSIQMSNINFCGKNSVPKSQNGENQPQQEPGVVNVYFDPKFLQQFYAVNSQSAQNSRGTENSLSQYLYNTMFQTINDSYEQIPATLRDKIPNFTHVSKEEAKSIYRKPIEFARNNHDELIAAVPEITGTYIESLSESFGDESLDSEDEDSQELPINVGEELSSNLEKLFTHFDKIFEETQRAVSGLPDEIWKKANAAANYNNMKILNAGFEADPKAVIDTIVSIMQQNADIPPQKETIDNYDGTITEVQNILGFKTEIVKSAKSKNGFGEGSYIKFTSSYLGQTLAEVAFNPDGTLKEYVSVDDTTGAKTMFIPDYKKNAVNVANIDGNIAAVRTFKRNDDGTFVQKGKPHIVIKQDEIN